jgi:hypothetical protein
MIDMTTQREAVAKKAKTVVDGTVAAGTKAVEASAGAAETATDRLKDVLARSKSFAETGITKVTAVKVGDKNVGERAHATVESMQSAVDVDQITGQVAKLREQIEGVLGTWKETFRPSTETAPKPAAKQSAAKKTNYNELTVDQLKTMASEADITGRSTMNKSQLIAALKKAEKASTSK